MPYKIKHSRHRALLLDGYPLVVFSMNLIRHRNAAEVSLQYNNDNTYGSVKLVEYKRDQLIVDLVTGEEPGE